MVSEATAISLAVWDAAVPVVAGETFAVKVGAKAADARALAGRHIAVSDASGAVVASGDLGEAPWPGTEALYWLALDVPAPAAPQVAAYEVRLADTPGEAEAAATAFTVVAAARPEHNVAVKITERDTSKPLADVEVRLGPFHARTGADGRAELRVCKGDYQIRLWRPAHSAAPQSLTVDGDTPSTSPCRTCPRRTPTRAGCADGPYSAASRCGAIFSTRAAFSSPH